MVTFAAELDIDAPPAQVWRALTDLALEPRWMQATRSVKFRAPAEGYCVGARMHRAGGFLGLKLEWDSEVTDYVPERLIAFAHQGAITGTSCWEIAPRGTGTHVRFWSTGPAPGPLKWFPARAAAGGRAGLKRDLKRLKDLVEGFARPD